MNVFELREKLIADYCSFVKGFITIKDDSIKEMVANELKDGLLWPDPLIQLSPFFESGESIEELIKSNILHPLCKQIFRIKIKRNYGFTTKPCWIAHVKDMCGINTRIVHDPEQGRVYPCPPDKVDIIKACFMHFGMI